MQEETADFAADQLRALIDDALVKPKNGELIGRLYTVNLTGSREETIALRTLAAIKGWAGEVKAYQQSQKPANKAPHLREVGADFVPAGREPADGLPEDWRDPPGYTCSNSGVWIAKEDKGEITESRVSARPIWIGARWADVDSGKHLVEICWPGGKEVIKRSTAMNSHEIHTLSDCGAPVSSVNARAVVQWLQASEEYNDDIIPVHKSIGRVGWTDHNGGRQLQGPDGPHLLRAEEGHRQTAQALAPRGTWAQWLDASKVVHQHPVPALLLAASVASVLLEATGAAPFVVDLHGHSSRGKTTALRWAASAWADPSDAGAYILPWSATLAAIEGRASFLRHLPLMLDDTKKVPPKDRERLAATVYQWGSGQGKARGMPGGVQTVAIWKSIMLSTGEAPLARLAGEHVGLRLRVLPVVEQPIPNNAEAVGVIEGLDAWGHLGPKVQAWANRHWDTLHKRWEVKRDAAAKKIAKGPSAQRLSGYLASIRIAVDALVDFGVEMPVEKINDLLFKSAEMALASADTSSEAWDRVCAWLVANSDRISEQKGALKSAKAPAGGWVGRALPDALAVSPPALEGELRRLGYDPEEVLPAWAERGLVRKADGRLTEVVWWLGRSTRMYVLIGAKGWDGKDTNAEGAFDADTDPVPRPSENKGRFSDGY